MNQSRNPDPLYAGPRQRPAGESRNNLASPLSARPEARPNDNMESNQTRAARYEDEKRRLIESCFAKKEDDGVLQESYITHVRVTEDAMFPSAPPPPDSAPANKKNRVILVAVRKSGRVRVHKARENPSGTFSIGKTWALDELSMIHIFSGAVPRNNREQLEQQWAGDSGFVVSLGKPYYWQAPTAKEKDFFIASLIKIYRKYTGGKIPELTGFLPHQMDQLTGATPKSTPDPAARSPRQEAVPSPAQLPAALGSRNLQSASSGQLREQDSRRIDQPLVSPLTPDEGYAASRQGQRAPLPEPVRSPARGDRNISNRDVQRNQRTPEPTASHFSSKDVSPAPAVNRSQAGLVKGHSLSPGSSQSSLPQLERTTIPSSKGLNGFTSPVRAPTDVGRSTPVFQDQDTSRNRSGSSNIPGDQHVPLVSDPTSGDSGQTTLPGSYPDRQRPYMTKNETSSSQKSALTSDSSRFATPLTTPSASRNEPAKPTASPKYQAEGPKAVPSAGDYFDGVSKSREPTPVASVPTPKEIVQEPAQDVQEPQVAEPSPPVLEEGKSPETQPISPSKDTVEEHRPGLGPMVKKRTQKDIANQLRKAAFAANAFKPREGGAAARLKAMQDKENKTNEPDGITGVVPAPLLRGMSSDSSRPDTPSQGLDKDLIPTPLSSSFAPKLQLQRSATEESLKSQDSSAKLKAEKSAVSAEAIVDQSISESRAPSPEKARSRSPQRRKRQRQEADIEKYSSSLGIDPRVFEGRGADFNDLLTEFGWEGRLIDIHKVDEFEADIRREIGRAQATGWLGHVEQQEGKVQELAKAFDKAIEECEELDGLFTLYSHELDTLAADIEYIEAQSQGLQVQTANQKLLQNELQNLLTTLSIPRDDLQDLQYSPLDNARGIASIEQALALLFKALLTIDPDIRQNKVRHEDGANADRSGVGVYADTEVGQMRAVREKKDDYREETRSFIRRFNQHMTTIFKQIEQRHSEDNSRSATSVSTNSLSISSHQGARQELWLYNVMMLFVREVNSYEWQTMITSYEMNMKSSYQDQFRDNAMNARRGVHKPTGEEQELLFTHLERDKSEDSLATTAARKLTVKRGKTVQTIATKKGVNGERGDGKPEAWEIFQDVLQQQAGIISEEQNFIVSFFHLNSQANVDFTELVSAKRPEERRVPNLTAKQSYDPDRAMAKIVQQVTEGIYSFWTSDLQGLLEWVLGLDQLQGVGVMCAIEQTLALYEDTNQEYITRALRNLHEKLVGLFHKFVNEQVRAIEETKVKLKKRKGIITFIRVFPAFSTAIESMMPADTVNHESFEVRFIVNDAYSKILKAMWESLSFIAKDDPATGVTSHSSAPAGGDPEDKEALNYHVLLIENMSHFKEEVDGRHNVVLDEWMDRAQHDLLTHMNHYIEAVIRRPLGKWLDFVESTEAMMKSSESFQTISNRPSHSKSSVKKILKNHDSSEVKKGAETLKKRIEKHFSDVDDPMVTSKSLILKVCDECNSRYSHAYDRMKHIIDKVYDGSVEIDWRKDEVATILKR